MSELSAYEKERLERIAKNQELLQSLQLGKSSSRDGTPESKSKSKSKSKIAPRRSVASSTVASGTEGEETPARRVSTRSRTTRAAALESKDPEAAKRKREEDEEEERKAVAAKKKMKHDDRVIEVWNPTGKFEIPEALEPLRQKLESVITSGTWPRALHPSIRTQRPTSPSKNGKKQTPKQPAARTRSSRSRVRKEESSDEEEAESEEDVKPTKTRGRAKKEESASEQEQDDDALSEEDGYKDEVSLKQLKETFDSMTLKAVKRVTPDRIYSMAIHPTEEKDLIFIGDRRGYLGIWDASADVGQGGENTGGDDDDDNEEIDRHAFAQRVYNDHGTIACLRLDPIKAHTIYTSSYDCTIRSLNFENDRWREVVDVDLLAAEDEGEGESLISGFEIAHNGNDIWVSDNRGGVTHQDLRSTKWSAERWKVSESKVGCIALNPANENYFVTAHLNRDLRLWDVRKLTQLDHAVTGYDEAFEQAAVASYTHGLACTSAFFDPSGRHLLSTSYDDTLRIWDVNPSKLSSSVLNKPKLSIKHDNKTGRYVTPFKSVWAPNPSSYPFFTVGSMDRALDIYGLDGKKIRQLSDGISTIPAVSTIHPSKPVIAGGAAGGKVYYWSANNWA